jgi:hypothetical protein
VIVDQPALGRDFYGEARFATEEEAQAALRDARIEVTDSGPSCTQYSKWDYSDRTLLVEDTPNARAFVEKHSYTHLDAMMRDTLRAVASEGGAVEEMLSDIEGRIVEGSLLDRLMPLGNPHYMLPGIPSPAMIGEDVKLELRALAIATDLVVTGNVQRRRGRISRLQNKLDRAGYGPVGG